MRRFTKVLTLVSAALVAVVFWWVRDTLPTASAPDVVGPAATPGTPRAETSPAIGAGAGLVTEDAPRPRPRATLRGRVLVSGAPPGMEVAIEVRRPWLGEGGALEVRTNRRGEFEVTDLPVGDVYVRPTGRYSLAASHYSARDSATGVAVAAPASGFELHLEPGGFLIGTVVEAATGNPVEGALVGPVFVFASHDVGVVDVGTDRDGRFRARVDLQGFDQLRVRAGPPSELLSGSEVVLDPSSIPRTPDGDYDVGVIELLPTSPLRFRVVDLAGRPVAGAHAASLDPSGGTVTDEDGYGTLRTAGGRPDRLVVQAACCWTQLVDLSTARDPIEVTLHPRNSITWQISRSSGSTPRRLRLAHSGSCDPAEAPLVARADDGTWTGAPDFARRFDGSEILHGFGQTAQGCIWRWDFEGDSLEVGGIRPGYPWAWRIFGLPEGTTREIAGVASPLGESERRTIRVRFDAPLRTLRGTVVDDAGQPVVAVVRLGTGRDPLRTDARGAFEVPGIESPGFIAITSDGFAPFVDRALSLSADPFEREFVLKRGLSLEVRLRDLDGSPVGDAMLEVRMPDVADAVPAVETRPGVYEITGLGDGEATLFARIGADALVESLRVDERVIDLTLALARVLLPWEVPPEFRDDVIGLLLVPEDDRRFTVPVRIATGGARGGVFETRLLAGRFRMYVAGSSGGRAPRQAIEIEIPERGEVTLPTVRP